MGYKNIKKQREYQLKWIKTRRHNWIKANGPCVQCGETSISKLLVHHKDKTQKENHRIWSWRKERRETELVKCEVRCVNCHADFHGLETPIPRHGTIARYKSKRKPCHCFRCRAANVQYEKQRKRKKSLEKP